MLILEHEHNKNAEKLSIFIWKMYLYSVNMILSILTLVSLLRMFRAKMEFIFRNIFISIWSEYLAKIFSCIYMVLARIPYDWVHESCISSLSIQYLLLYNCHFFFNQREMTSELGKKWVTLLEMIFDRFILFSKSTIIYSQN